jgi:hypothetical protein
MPRYTTRGRLGSGLGLVLLAGSGCTTPADDDEENERADDEGGDGGDGPY